MARSLPSGIVTFVLTDVVGSTRLWQDAADRMDTAIARHVDLIEAAVTAHGGVVLKNRGEGDSTFSVFTRASDAVFAAHEAQQALRREQWPEGAALSVRFALHTGEAVERDSDYLGPVVNRAARLRSIARGGEVLLSGTTAALVQEHLSEGLELVELGDVQLRDLERAERVFALAGPGLDIADPSEPRASLTGPPIVDVRLLGPVAAVIDGEPVDVGGPKERTLLALLALAGGPLTAERLIDDLWDGAPPASARKTLQTYAWRLRQVLTDEVLVTVTAGYEIRLDRGTDVARFEQMVDDASGSLASEDAAGAADRLADALELWRGDPLGGCVPTATVEAHRVRLRELRELAVERRLEAELQQGRHAHVVPELQRLVHDEPFREERWRLLVLALYRCGRQADALRAYQRARTTLVEGLGVEPGPALRTLEQAILEQSDELNGDATPERQRPIAAPQRDLAITSPPIPTVPLVGRDHELAELDELLAHHRLVTLTGVGGGGKTRLALAVAERHRERPVAFCDLSPLSRGGSVVRVLARSVGVATDAGAQPAASQSELVERLIHHLQEASLLVVIDNCEHVLEPCAEVVEQVLSKCRYVGFLATSREPLGVAGEHVLAVPPLGLPDRDTDLEAGAVKLFEQRAAAAKPGFRITPANQRAVFDICHRLEGLPLALELAAARLSHLTAHDVATRLERPLALLASRRSAGPARHRTLQATLDWSHELLDPVERSLFRRLAVFAGRFSLEDVEACCAFGLEGASIVDLLGGLVERSLVTVDSSGISAGYRLLDTIRRYAWERLTASDDEDEARGSHCRWCLDRLEAIPLAESVLTRTSMPVLLDLHEDVRRGLVWAEEAERNDLVARLVTSIMGLWQEGHYDEPDRWFPVAVAHESSRPPGERTATALASLMYLFRWDGDRDLLKAHRQRLAALVENFPARHALTSLAYSTLASACSRLPGEVQHWERYADLALENAPEDSPALDAMARCQKARALLFRGEHAEAIAFLEEAVERLGPAAEDYRFAPQEDLALAHHLAGHDEQALAIAEARVDRAGSPTTWYVNIYAGLAAAALGASDRARRHLRRAAEIEQVLSMPLAENDCRAAAGALALLEGRRATAVDLLAGLSTGSVSFNPVGVLLEHYRSRAQELVAPEEWRQAEAANQGRDLGPLVRAELGIASG